MLGAMYVALGGFQHQLDSLDRIASELAEARSEREPGHSADLLVRSKVHQRVAEANVVAMRIVDETVGHLIDVFA